MKKVLKIVGFGLLALIAVWLIRAATMPSDFLVERSTVIEANPAFVFPYTSSFAKMNQWSPWMKLDPNMEQNIEGEDGTVGAKHSWSGNGDVGKGSQEITAIEPNKKVTTKLVFLEPMAAESEAAIAVAPEGDNTKVTWSLSGTNSFTDNLFLSLMGGMDAAVGKDYEEGLANLKAMVEKDLAEQPSYDIQQIDFSGQKYVGFRSKIGFDKITATYQEKFPEAMGIVQNAKAEMAGMPCGLFYEWDVENSQTDMAAAIPVKELPADLPDTAVGIDIPAGKALRIDYYGEYEGTGAAHDAIDAYMKANNLTGKTPCIEQYITDPTTEPDPKKWLTTVTYFIE